MGQFKPFTGKVCDKENEEGLNNQWDRDEKNVQWIIDDNITLEREQEYQCNQKANASCVIGK